MRSEGLPIALRGPVERSGVTIRAPRALGPFGPSDGDPSSALRGSFGGLSGWEDPFTSSEVGSLRHRNGLRKTVKRGPPKQGGRSSDHKFWVLVGPSARGLGTQI